MGELRETKKRERRQRISDVATELFHAHGFDQVTIEEIAAAADVSKMTVFNYFARKEDLMFDREDDLKLVFLRDAIRARPEGQAPTAALLAFIETLRGHESPYTRIDKQTAAWWRVVEASAVLQARLREIADDASHELALELAGPKPDGVARLVAGTIVLTWRTAFTEAFRMFERGASARKANTAFVALLERGFVAAHAMATRATPRSSAKI